MGHDRKYRWFHVCNRFTLANGRRVGICISRRNNNGVSQLSSAAKWFRRRHASWQHCVVLRKQWRIRIFYLWNKSRGRQVCQRVRPSRHVRQCLGVVPGLEWGLFISKRDQSHRTRDWDVPFVARRQLVLRLQRLPRVAALQRPARQHRHHRRVPCRQDSGPCHLLSFSSDWFDSGRYCDHDHWNKFD